MSRFQAKIFADIGQDAHLSIADSETSEAVSIGAIPPEMTLQDAQSLAQSVQTIIDVVYMALSKKVS